MLTCADVCWCCVRVVCSVAYPLLSQPGVGGGEGGEGDAEVPSTGGVAGAGVGGVGGGRGRWKRFGVDIAVDAAGKPH
jgi:hypothetical protein